MVNAAVCFVVNAAMCCNGEGCCVKALLCESRLLAVHSVYCGAGECGTHGGEMRGGPSCFECVEICVFLYQETTRAYSKVLL